MLAFRFCVVVSAGAIAILGYRADALAGEMPLAVETQSERAVAPSVAPEVAPSEGVADVSLEASNPVVVPTPESAPTVPVGSEVILDAFKAALNETETTVVREEKPAPSEVSPEAVLTVETTPDRAPRVLEKFKQTIARFEGVEHAIVTENPTEPERPISTSVSPAFAGNENIPFDRILQRFRSSASHRTGETVLPSEQAIPVSEHLLNPERHAIDTTVAPHSPAPQPAAENRIAPSPQPAAENPIAPLPTAATVPTLSPSPRRSLPAPSEVEGSQVEGSEVEGSQVEALPVSPLVAEFRLRSTAASRSAPRLLVTERSRSAVSPTVSPSPQPTAENPIAPRTVLEAFAAIARNAATAPTPAPESPALAQRQAFTPFERILNRVNRVTFSPPETQPSTEFSTPTPEATTEQPIAPEAILAAFTRTVKAEATAAIPPFEPPKEVEAFGTTPNPLATAAPAVAENPAPLRAETVAAEPPALDRQAFDPFSRILDRFKTYRPSEPAAANTTPPSDTDDFSAPSPRSVLNAFQQVILNPPNPAAATPTPDLVSQTPLPVIPPNPPPTPQPADPLSALDSPAYFDGSSNPLLFPARPEDVQIDITKPISLQDAIELARRNNPTLRGARLELDVAREQMREALAAEYPTLSTQFNLTRTDSAQQDLSNRQNPLSSRANNTISTSADARLELSYDLLTGGRRSAQIKAAEEQIRFRQLNAETLAEQTRFEVTSNYYDLQEADARVNIERGAVADATQTLRDAQLLEQAGLGTRFDVLRAQVDLANSQQNLATAQSRQVISRRTLANVLGISQQANVTAADPIERAGKWELPLTETIVLAFRNRAELEQQVVQRNISEQQRQVALSALRPQVSLFANYNVLGLVNDNQGLADGYTVGARMQWALFDGGAAAARAAQQEKNMELAASRFDDQRNKVRLEVEQAYNNLQASETNIQTANVGLQLAQESLRLARLRFSAGVGTQTEVINAQTELTRARGNLLTAIINYNRSLASLQRAVSNFPDNRLFDIENNQ